MDLTWLELVKECVEARGLDFGDSLERIKGDYEYQLARAEFADSRGENVREPRRMVHEVIKRIFFDDR